MKAEIATIRVNEGHAMSPVVLQNSSGSVIRSVETEPDSWQLLAPPQEPHQWKDGYSAKELAKLWFRNGTPLQVPEPFQSLFESQDSLRDLEIEVGICEVVTQIDAFGGKHRHHDQILIGNAGDRRTVVGVEAKCEEEFGPIIKDYLDDPTKGGKPGSKIPARIRLLKCAIFGKSSDETALLRYQLLHAFAGTIIEAKNRSAKQAVFLVCEFVHVGVVSEKTKRNQHDFEAFVRAVTRQEAIEVKTGQLLGPIHVPGGEFVPAGIPVFLGKVTINLDS